jgi:hypothetical protein
MIQVERYGEFLDTVVRNKGDRIRRTRRQEEAVYRQERHDQRSPEQQIALLDQRLGEGVGAKRERARLAQ